MKAEYACLARLIADMVDVEMKVRAERERGRQDGPF